MSDVLAQLRAIAVDAASAFGLLALIFIPLEKAYPAVRQSIVRRESGLDLAFFLGQQLCFGLLILHALVWLHAQCAALPLEGVRPAFHAQPFALRVIEAVMLGDLFAYWGHRAQHRFEPLWRFHALHHSSEKLDWLAAHREHPLDGIYTQVLLNLPLCVLGFSLEAAAGVIVFRGVWAVFIHSNVRMALGPLAYLFGSPELHHLHHSKQREAVNFGNLSPWTDLVFGTHARNRGAQEELGLLEPMRGGYVRMLLDPLVSKLRPEPRVCQSLEDEDALCARRARADSGGDRVVVRG
jgi:sterol desaturase/sphingolipid hydroxylase (fatty acid hydroxylase superfamily)